MLDIKVWLDGEKVEMLYFKRYDGSWERDNTISEDIFTDNPTSIVKIGKGFKEILEIRDNAKKGMLVESEM